MSIKFTNALICNFVWYEKELVLHFPASYEPCLIKGGSKEPIVENWKRRGLTTAGNLDGKHRDK